ncbi:MAG: SRPBCC domain-containing protein [Actinomycetota bacterium]|nr:SRPBCC domain-containing protein [Actinomycetota bacterium]
MSVVSVESDLDNLTLTLVADFDSSVERVWELWADPRKLERWWGPPSHPATIEEHDLSSGGTVTYFMTSPEGDRHRGWWRVDAVDPPRSLQFTDGFADEEGRPVSEMPTSRASVELSEHEGGTRMTMRSRFETREQMQELVDMGMAEGIREAVGQMDALLA